MAVVQAVLIVVGGVTKAVQLPVGCQPADVIVKFQTEDGLVPLSMDARLNGRTAVLLAGAVDASRERRATGIERARETRDANTATHERTASDFISRLSDVQGPIAARLFKTLQFGNERDGYSPMLGKWLSGVMECCPEPWRLEWWSIREWLSNPASVANLTRLEGNKSPTMVRRAVARKMLIAAWNEQVGQVVTPAVAAPALRAGDLDRAHPFSVIHRDLQVNRFASREAVRAAVTQYREAGALTGAEQDQAERMIRTGTWLNDIAIPRGA